MLSTAGLHRTTVNAKIATVYNAPIDIDETAGVLYASSAGTKPAVKIYLWR